MLTKFVLDPDALPVAGAQEVPHYVREQHERLLEKWGEAGVLVYPGSSWRDSELGRRIDSAPVSIRKLYQTSISKKCLRMMQAPPDCPCVSACQSVEDLRAFSGVAGLACLEDTRAAVVGLQEHESCRTPADNLPEIVRVGSIDRSAAYHRFRELSVAPIVAGSDVNTVWRERFDPFARHARTLVVIDRYLGEEVVARGRRSWHNFITRVDGSGHRCNVTLFVGNKDSSPENVLSAFDSFRSTRGGVGNLDVYVLQDRFFMGRQPEFRGGAHGRLIRFDHQAVLLDAGLELFADTQAGRDYQFSIVPWQKENSHQLQELIMNATVSSRGS